MNYNPKVVSIDRSAAYVHARAMKNRRDNNPIDALELLRQAVNQEPENTEYKLDLAEMLCDRVAASKIYKGETISLTNVITGSR